MFGINANCSCEMVNKLPEAECPWDIIADSIGKLMKIEDMESEVICTKYYTFWSVVHGLVSINFLDRGNSDEVNRQVLRDAVTGISAHTRDYRTCLGPMQFQCLYAKIS